jgi:hypothetical protein
MIDVTRGVHEFGGRQSKITPDGTHAFFVSPEKLTAYENEGVREAYVYDYAADQVLCTSCRPDGTPPGAPVTLSRQGVGVADAKPDYLPRYISDDGERAFFGTLDSLLPRDTNKRTDVYEYSQGTVALITSGTDPFDSWFGDSSADGDDIFFNTYARLVGADKDANQDVYDARLGGGIAAQAGSQPAPSCVGESCQGQPGVEPIAPAPGTVGLTYQHNPPRPCAKGKHRVKTKTGSKCVKKKKAKSPSKRRGRAAHNREAVR